MKKKIFFASLLVITVSAYAANESQKRQPDSVEVPEILEYATEKLKSEKTIILK